MGCVWVYIQKMELRYWWEYGDEKTRVNKWNEKRPLIPLLSFKIPKKNLSVRPFCLPLRAYQH